MGLVCYYEKDVDNEIAVMNGRTLLHKGRRSQYFACHLRIKNV
jgi:hypothetical protein